MLDIRLGYLTVFKFQGEVFFTFQPFLCKFSSLTILGYFQKHENTVMGTKVTCFKLNILYIQMERAKN